MSVLLDDKQRKIHPKLHMIVDGDLQVNMHRAEQCAAMIIEDFVAEKTTFPGRTIAVQNTESRIAAAEAPSVPETPPTNEKIAEGVVVDVFVQIQDGPEPLPPWLARYPHRDHIIAASIPLTRLNELCSHPRVLHVELGTMVTVPTTEDVRKGVDKPSKRRWQFDSPEGMELHEGRGVLIGIIDVGGFDFAHPDFLDEKGQTRFAYIWDQGGDARPSPAQRDSVRFGRQFDYGAEFRKEDLDFAIASAKKIKLPPQELERQSQMFSGSHATHVASIAAGNLGVCRQATIAGVLIDIPEAEMTGRSSFYDTIRLAHAVEYLLLVAQVLNMPISINISLGTNGHAHDGTGHISRWIDNVLTTLGRSVCVAAGNAGQEVAAFPGDLGYVMGRIHTSGKLEGRFPRHEIEWEVVGNSRVDQSENEFEIWYSASDRFAVSIRPPGDDIGWLPQVKPGEYIENYQLGAKGFVSIYNELYHPANGSNYIAIYLAPFMHGDTVIGIQSGTWRVRLHGLEVRDGAFHGWIERDDPRKIRSGATILNGFPSYFSEASNVDNSSIGSLGCGRHVIAVANLSDVEEKAHITSSQGPTRDNRFKPDIIARGTNIIAANGFSDQLWIKKTGTSMASPYVAGVIGLMLECEHSLTAAQISGILQRTSRPLLGQPFAWSNDSGFGLIQPTKALAEVAGFLKREKKL